jgi:multicomponent Na+:H+ antiporter subunit B
MNSQILHIAARIIKPLFVLTSLVVLYRGHNMPGGGFIGGLLAASGYIFYMLAYDVKSTLKKMWIKPFELMAWGLLMAFASGFAGLFHATPFLTGRWISVFGIKLGSPTLFDVGVYLTVIGVLLTIMVAILDKEKKWD